MGANAHPFFNSGTSADQAGTFLQGQIEIVAGICSGKEVFVLETGWPHAGEPNGAAVPGMSEQAAAIKGIVEVAGKNAAIFSFEDDLWKDPGAFGVERSWGCSDQFA
jgi:exo-beta-1,3-glucanase (GH17 family)